MLNTVVAFANERVQIERVCAHKPLGSKTMQKEWGGGGTPWAASETEETEAFPGIASLQNGLHEIA